MAAAVTRAKGVVHLVHCAMALYEVYEVITTLAALALFALIKIWGSGYWHIPGGIFYLSAFGYWSTFIPRIKKS
jgi:hypothetical protein